MVKPAFRSTSLAIAAVATLATAVSAQTFRRAAACPDLGCIYPPVRDFPPILEPCESPADPSLPPSRRAQDQSTFIAGQVRCRSDLVSPMLSLSH